MPELITARPPLAFCGHDTVVRLPNGDVHNRGAWACMLDAAAAGDGAEIVVDSLTLEGGNIREIVRVTPGGEIEAWQDTTQDHFGNGGWLHLKCGDVTDAPIRPEEPWIGWQSNCELHEVHHPPDVPASLTGEEMAALESLVMFARDPGGGHLDRVPTSRAGVWLGLGDELLVLRSTDELDEPSAWVLQAEAFGARTGPFSALDFLADRSTSPMGALTREASVTVGPRTGCAGDLPAPMALDDARRLSIRPVGVEDCFGWWAVDVYFDVDGAVTALTLDLWEP